MQTKPFSPPRKIRLAWPGRRTGGGTSVAWTSEEGQGIRVLEDDSWEEDHLERRRVEGLEDQTGAALQDPAVDGPQGEVLSGHLSVTQGQFPQTNPGGSETATSQKEEEVEGRNQTRLLGG